MNDEIPTRAARVPRSVQGNHALVWFGEAIRLWKRRPVVFSLMAVVVLAASVAFEAIPIASLVASTVVAPLLACGFLYGSLAADRGERPRLAHLVAVLSAPWRALAAVIVAGLLVTLVESAFAWALADVNLFLPSANAVNLTPGAILAIYAAGVLASLPVQFVPMAVLFDGEAAASAFANSLQACRRNPRAMLSFAVYSYALLMAGLATMGVGLVLTLPWIAIAAYAAWKDIYGVDGGAPRR